MLFCRWAILVAFIAIIALSLVFAGVSIGQESEDGPAFVCFWVAMAVLFFMLKWAGTFSLIF